MSKLEVDKIDPQSGTNLELGTSGDTVTIPTGVTLDASNATTTLPANIVTTDGTQTLTNKTIAAGSNTVTGLTNSNLSGSAAISNANLANSSITINDTAVSLGGSTSISTGGMYKNLIINGDMSIDQRNSGSSVTVGTVNPLYTLDRMPVQSSQSSKFSIQQNAGSVTPPTYFKNYIGATSLSAYTVASGDYFTIRQGIEGSNIINLAWGTSDAKTVTLSFWVRSSLTGTFGGSFTNSAFNRSYPFSYTITSANTWEKKSITVAGDTSGTWLTTNGVGIYVTFGLGVGSTYSGTAGAWSASGLLSATGATSVVGTNAATFYMTGLQLEAGTSASDFEFLPFDVNLQRCERYFEKSYNLGTTPGTASYGSSITVPPNTGSRQQGVYFKTRKRSSATIVLYSPANGASGAIKVDGSNPSTSVPDSGESSFRTSVSGGVGIGADAAMHFTAEAEL